MNGYPRFGWVDIIRFQQSTNRRWKRFLLIYPLSPTNLPYMNSTMVLYSSGFLSSTSPSVIMKFSNSPFSLHIRCSLKPKNHPMEHLPLCAMPLNTLWICILWFLHTLRGVLSTKLILVIVPCACWMCCLISSFYIKPQLQIIIQIYIFSCLISSFYIKPQ